MKFLSYAVFASVIVGRLAGQTAAELEGRQGDDALASARAWVHDGDPRHLAWAAFWAGRDNLTQLEPDLVKELSAYQGGSKTWNGNAVPEDVDAEAVADALIRFGAHVPEKTAAVLYPKLAAQALILLSRASDDPQVTLERIFKESEPFEWLTWLAAADLLAVSHPQSIAPRLLSDFTMTLNVRVLDPGQKAGPGLGGGCAADYFGHPDLTLPEWPAIREYKLSLEGSADGEVAKGANAVYFQSWETRFYDPYEHDNDCHLGKKAKLRYGLIRQLADLPADTFPLKLHNEASITYSSDSLYVSDVEALVFRQRDIYESVVQRFQTIGFLTEADASAEKLSLNLEIDNRTERSLPVVEVENFGVQDRKPE